MFIDMWCGLPTSIQVKSYITEFNSMLFLHCRNCSNPSPQFGGITCIGSAVDTILCNISNVTCPGIEYKCFDRN